MFLFYGITIGYQRLKIAETLFKFTDVVHEIVNTPEFVCFSSLNEFNEKSMCIYVVGLECSGCQHWFLLMLIDTGTSGSHVPMTLKNKNSFLLCFLLILHSR